MSSSVSFATVSALSELSAAYHVEVLRVGFCGLINPTAGRIGSLTSHGSDGVKPLTLFRSLPLFAIPSIALALVLYKTIPITAETGVPLALAVTTEFILVMGGLAVMAWIGARHDKEGGQRIVERLRLVRPRWSDVFAGFLLGVFMLATFTALQWTGDWLRNVIPWGPPAWMAEFMTRTHFQGMPLADNWWPVLVYF